MADTPTPVFDAGGWCLDMSAAPRDGRPLDLWQRNQFGEYLRVDDCRWIPQPVRSGLPSMWVNGNGIALNDKYVIAWRYPPAPPVEEK